MCSSHDAVFTMHQAQALIRAIEALDAVEPAGLIERIVVGLLRTVYIQRLRRMSVTMPMWAVRSVAGARERARAGKARPVPTIIGDWW